MTDETGKTNIYAEQGLHFKRQTVFSSTLQQTSLFDLHTASGGKIVPFARWDLPVQFSGVKAEVLAVRAGCGLFDVSHMGQLDVRGEGVTEALNQVVSADWSRVGVGRAAYALLLNSHAGIQDDIMGYRLGQQHWLLVVNASRARSDEEWLRRALPPRLTLSNRYSDQAMIAVQGPDAQAILQTLCTFDLQETLWRDVIETEVLGRKAVVARGGYTGCDGFEWMGDAATAPLLWRALQERGAVACGLGARDILRVEAGLPLYGHELGEEWTPDASGVAFAVSAHKDSFVGRTALLAYRASDGRKQAIHGLQMLGRAIPREGYAVWHDGLEVGVVTSGTLSPTLEAGIALARLPASLPLETLVDVAIRGVLHPARLRATPFVARTTKRA